MGLPITNAASLFLNFSKNSVAILSTAINLFDAIQHSPLLFIRPITAHSTALSISASSKIIKASLPPNSNTDFFKYLPASAAILAPAASLPVSDTPFILLSQTNSVALLPEIKRLVYSPAGAPASLNISSIATAHCGTIEACFISMVLPAIILGAAKRATW